MHITSTAFQPNEPIPALHSHDGGNTPPPLTFSEVPREAKSLALVVEDPDAPSGTFTHWILHDMSPATLQILSGELPMDAKQAINDFGRQAYDGPKPPTGTHRYVFRLFALDTPLGLPSAAKRTDFDAAIKGHVIDHAELTGTFSVA